MRPFHVKVGHAEVTVEARDREHAVQRAKRRLSIEMPRLWDVIHQIDTRGFHVDEVD
ncbi:MAG: hypothetical protein IH987_21035 [Planctomycetes bacterium]|nr:hypothetical protein [Planctomycetota bacterium]